jgi:hypothetical protein
MDELVINILHEISNNISWSFHIKTGQQFVLLGISYKKTRTDALFSFHSKGAEKPAF